MLQHVLTSKIIRIHQKNGGGLLELMDNYGFPNEKSICKAIRGFFKEKEGNRIISDLRRNDKKSARASIAVTSNIEQSTSTEENENISSNETTSPIPTDEIWEEEIEDSNVSIVYPHKSREEQLEELQTDEKTLSAEVTSLELRHKELVRERASTMDSIKQKAQTLKALQEQFKTERCSLESLVCKYTDLKSEMTSVTSERNELAELLDDIRNSISSLKKVVIYMYEDGSIEYENLPSNLEADIQLEYTYLDRLVRSPQAKVVKSIAKVLALVDTLKLNSMDAELIFESSALSDLFYYSI